MIDSMVLRHSLAGLIWAAILVVALQFVPTLAFAHAGHSHHSSETLALTHANASEHAKSEASGQKHLQVLTAASETGQPCSSCPGRGCAGKCCGTGLCCSAAVTQAP